jgi:nucleotide-binding universal stress UspA family protein
MDVPQHASGTQSSNALFDRIVVSLDGSEVAESALPKASALARTLGVELNLLRVIDLGRLEQYGGFGFGIEYAALDLAVQDERVAAREYLERVQQRLAGDGLRVTTEHREGLAAREIVAALRPGDLLVMASHGRTGVQRWFIGSVAEEVVRQAPVPVMLLRAPKPDG